MSIKRKEEKQELVEYKSRLDQLAPHKKVSWLDFPALHPNATLTAGALLVMSTLSIVAWALGSMLGIFFLLNAMAVICFTVGLCGMVTDSRYIRAKRREKALGPGEAEREALEACLTDQRYVDQWEVDVERRGDRVCIFLSRQGVTRRHTIEWLTLDPQGEQDLITAHETIAEWQWRAEECNAEARHKFLDQVQAEREALQFEGQLKEQLAKF
jgi:hypothetical protein